jgi:DNA polymerase III sliding clamp (beta) subunit (PCNA family)
MKPFVIRADHVGLLMPFASTETTRYYLAGVNLAANPLGGVEACATDGHRLAMFWDRDGLAGDAGKDQSIIVPMNKDLVRLCKASNSDNSKYVREEARRHRYVVVDPDKKLVSVVLAIDPATAATAAIEDKDHLGLFKDLVDGTYPAYGRVIPSWDPETPQHHGTFNGHLLTDFIKLRTAKTKTVLKIFQQGAENPAIVRIDGMENFIGLVMPVRGSEVIRDMTDPIPEWVKASANFQRAIIATREAAEAQQQAEEAKETDETVASAPIGQRKRAA